MLAFLLFGTAGLLQAAYWLLLRTGFRRARSAAAAEARETQRLPAMTVVVAARDEEANLPELLSALARQTHPDYEVVLVDDASTDGTRALLEAWCREHPAFRLVAVDDPVPPRKKHALTRGIAAASHELLAFTDADCTPPPGWLSALARRHASAEEDVLLVGYSPFRRGAGILNAAARYETFVTGFLTAAAVGLGRPYMAVGRNLSYSAALFRRIGGFRHSLDSLSGDDDLLVQEVARRRAAPVRHVFEPASFVPTDAPASWAAWLRQKTRHTSAGRFYPRAVQLHLALFQGSGIVLWFAPLAMGWAGAALLAARLGLQAFVLREAADALDERALLPSQPLLELGYAAYNLLVAPVGVLRMPKRW